MTLTIFTILAVASVLTALMVVFSKSPVHSVLYLIVTFFIIAAQYIMLNAQFLAVVHLIVYAGAIMVLFLFVLMLLNLNQDTEPQKSSAWKIAAALASGLLFLTFVGALKGSSIAAGPGVNPRVGLVQNLGNTLFKDFVVPFEIAGILFLAAMVGAVLVGKREVNV
jgi:NADH-quinone oxidoreductase subunit J